jgi:hypothetical protein
MEGLILLEYEELRLKLSSVKDKLLKANIPWGIFAGAAAYCYGSKRNVTDIDLIVRSMDYEKAKTVLEGIKDLDIAANLEIKTSQGICHFFMDDEMIDRTRWEQFLGITVPVITVEDNIIFKAILQRGEEQGKYDISDIKTNGFK